MNSTEAWVSWAFAVLLLLVVGVYVVANWQSVVPPLLRIISAFVQ